MAMPIPAATFFTYNGFVFPSNALTQVDEEPVESGDGRTVKFSRIKIRVSGFITQTEADQANPQPGGTLDAAMKNMRLKLQKNGAWLQYVSKGYGLDLDINGPHSRTTDVFFGPKAGKLWWKPLGGAPDGAHGAMYSWEVITHTPECQSPVFLGRVNELSFTVNYSTSEDGLVIITTAGRVQIPLSLRDVLNQNIDNFFASVVGRVPLGFLRHIDRRLSADRCWAEFTITDRQIEVPFPNDVVDMSDMRHRIKQTVPYSPIWDCTISATVRMSPTAPKAWAWFRFFTVCSARIAWANAHGFTQNQGFVPQPFAAGRNNVTRPQAEMEEMIFKNEARFTVRYQILGAPMSRVIISSGLWQPVVNRVEAVDDEIIRFDLWRTSLAGNAQATLGVLGAKFPASGDVIIDVCSRGNNTVGANVAFSNNTPPQVVAAAGESPNGSNGYSRDIEPANLLAPDKLDDDGESQFAPDSSWMYWTCRVRRVTDGNFVRHKPLAGTVTIDTPTVDPLGNVSDVASDDSEPSAGWSATVPDVIQQRCAPTMGLQLIGHCTRVAYRANAPKLISYADLSPTLAHEDISETTLAMQDGVTLFRTDWTLTYWFETAPESLPMPANPFLRTQGDNGSGPSGGAILTK